MFNRSLWNAIEKSFWVQRLRNGLSISRDKSSIFYYTEKNISRTWLLQPVIFVDVSWRKGALCVVESHVKYKFYVFSIKFHRSNKMLTSMLLNDAKFREPRGYGHTPKFTQIIALSNERSFPPQRNRHTFFFLQKSFVSTIKLYNLLFSSSFLFLACRLFKRKSTWRWLWKNAKGKRFFK